MATLLGVLAEAGDSVAALDSNVSRRFAGVVSVEVAVALSTLAGVLTVSLDANAVTRSSDPLGCMYSVTVGITGTEAIGAVNGVTDTSVEPSLNTPS
jgi:hypothetical protein